MTKPNQLLLLHGGKKRLLGTHQGGNHIAYILICFVFLVRDLEQSPEAFSFKYLDLSFLVSKVYIS